MPKHAAELRITGLKSLTNFYGRMQIMHTTLAFVCADSFCGGVAGEKTITGGKGSVLLQYDQGRGGAQLNARCGALVMQGTTHFLRSRLRGPGIFTFYIPCTIFI